MTANPYYVDGSTTLYCGDMREVLPRLIADGLRADLIVADPPYEETGLVWDRWPDGWVAAVGEAAKSMWCFGSMRMLLRHRDEFDGWKISQDVVWEKTNGSGVVTDRFRRVHEYVTHWYRGPWRDVYHETPRVAATVHHGPRPHARSAQATHMSGGRPAVDRPYIDDGTRLIRSVIRARSVRGGGHRTEKPFDVLDPLIRYGCPSGGTVLDPFAGSGSTAAAARLSGRRAVLIEADEQYCERIAARLAQGVLVAGSTGVCPCDLAPPRALGGDETEGSDR